MKGAKPSEVPEKMLESHSAFRIGFFFRASRTKPGRVESMVSHGPPAAAVASVLVFTASLAVPTRPKTAQSMAKTPRAWGTSELLQTEKGLRLVSEANSLPCGPTGPTREPDAADMFYGDLTGGTLNTKASRCTLRVVGTWGAEHPQRSNNC